MLEQEIIDQLKKTNDLLSQILAHFSNQSAVVSARSQQADDMMQQVSQLLKPYTGGSQNG